MNGPENNAKAARSTQSDGDCVKIRFNDFFSLALAKVVKTHIGKISRYARKFAYVTLFAVY
jgi:hypothetical protein